MVTSPRADDNRQLDWRALNRANWDERVALHVASDFYRVEDVVAGTEPLHGFEYAEIGDVSGKELVHLQCHFGLDTLALARRGARVTGVDFSQPAVQVAGELAARLGIDARFVTADVYDARDAVTGDCDVVYTGKGALNWLPDMPAWARVVASLLRPGGFLYLAEYHPLLFMLGDDELTFDYPYFNDGPQLFDDPADYASTAVLANTRTVEWPHPLSDVVTSLIDAGLVLEFLHEHAECGFRRFPHLVESAPRTWTAPPGMPALPLMYSLRARKPA